MHLTVIS